MEINYNLNKFFEELFANLKCQPATRAYITSVFLKYKCSQEDLSKDSLTLVFAQARNKQDFCAFQNLGDWIFFCKSTNHSLNSASEDYYHTVGRLSYYSCYKLINKKWPLFEELADNFIVLEDQAKKILEELKPRNDFQSVAFRSYTI